MSNVSKPGSRQRVNKACVVCRRRKIKCNGVEPCINCESSGLICSFELKPKRISIYKQEEDIRKELRTTINYRKSLENLPSIGTDELETLVSEMESTLKKYRDRLRLSVSQDAITNYNRQTSVETTLVEVGKIVFNQYERDLVREHSTNEGRQPINSYFGLYTPLTLFSNEGFGWLFKKMFANTLDQEETKKTFYLYLKFFDMSSLWFLKSLEQSGAPLEYCRKHYKPAYKDSGSTMDLVVDMMDDVNMIILDNEIQFNDLQIQDPAQIIVGLVKLVKKHNDHFREKSRLITHLDIKQLYMTEEYIHLVFLEFYQKAAFGSLFAPDYVETILDFLDCTSWKEEYSTINEIVSPIIARAINSGLNRWEYYVAMSEEQADKQRYVWWRCYWWDKWNSVLAGKTALIQNETMDCLLPRRWMELGIDESMDLDVLIKSLDYELAYNNGVIYEVSYYVLAKVLDYNSVSITYNRRFTDFRIFSANFNDIDKVADELLGASSKLISIIELFQSKMAPYFEKIDKTGYELDFFAIFHYCYNEILTSNENLIIRVLSRGNFSNESRMKTRLDELRRSSVEISHATLEKLLLNKSLFNSIRLIKMTSLSIMRIVTLALDQPGESMLESAVLLCKFLGRYAFDSGDQMVFNLDTTYIYEQQPTVVLVFSFLLVRILLQAILNAEIATREELLACMTDQESLSMCKNLLEITSPCFAPLLQEIEMGGLHKEVLRKINDMTGSQFFANFKKPAASGKGGQTSLSLHTPTEDLISLVNLDDFLALDIFPHVYEAVWQNFNTPPEDE